jgi:hypothetical protein
MMDKILTVENVHMTRTISKIILPLLLILILALLTPLSAQADGETDGLVQTVNGYQVALAFAENPAVGENQIHVQIHDALDMPVSDATVEVALGPAEEEHHVEVPESTGHESMPGMDMAEPAIDHGTTTHEKMQVVLLEPSHHEKGEYSGEVHIESTGDWTVTVHLNVQDELMEVDFPLTVKSSSRNVILTGFAGANILILIVAAVLKSKSISK